jgi:hypothetical protein
MEMMEKIDGAFECYKDDGPTVAPWNHIVLSVS